MLSKKHQINKYKKNICGQRKLKVSSTKLHNQGSPSFPPGQVTQATVLIGMGGVQY
jgi:hypothetical protein